jgi:hypothetical protein
MRSVSFKFKFVIIFNYAEIGCEYLFASKRICRICKGKELKKGKRIFASKRIFILFSTNEVFGVKI